MSPDQSESYDVRTTNMIGRISIVKFGILDLVSGPAMLADFNFRFGAARAGRNDLKSNEWQSIFF